MIKLKYIALSIFILLGAGKAAGQDTANVKPPVAILVQIKAERNRINALTNMHQYKLLEELKTDRDKVKEVMINDFTDHFSYCPVYYFIDTNYDKIKDKHLPGYLLNADGSVANNPPIISDSTHYHILMYGKGMKQGAYQQVIKDTAAYVYSAYAPYGAGMVLMNENMQQIGYIYNLDYAQKSLKRKWGPKYCYQSKHFDIEYFPCAKLLNKKMRENPYRISLQRMN